MRQRGRRPGTVRRLRITRSQGKAAGGGRSPGGGNPPTPRKRWALGGKTATRTFPSRCPVAYRRWCTARARVLPGISSGRSGAAAATGQFGASRDRTAARGYHAIQAVPAGLPDNARIRTAADVFPYAVAALGKPDALALMALLDSDTYLAGTLLASVPATPTGTRFSMRCSTRLRLLASLPERRHWGRRLPCWPRSRRAARYPRPRPSTTRRRPHTPCWIAPGQLADARRSWTCCCC